MRKINGETMDTTKMPIGKTTISPEVLVSIALLATMSVEGVSRMSPVPRDINSLFKKGLADGVAITVEDNMVYTEICVILKNDVKVREVCKQIQNQVSRSISEMVGMEVGRVNIHVEDIDFSD
ncbi:MAG: Asp23/Gls24 family envelope stress response protein [Anaerolineae bacterium]|nr:Asp23/Gls24 family envelope stress response protein [Anaerolineae bacterium]